MSGQPQTLGGIGGLDNGSYGGPNSARPSTGAQSYRSGQPQTLGGIGRPYGAPPATRPHTGPWDDSVNPWQDQGGPHTPTFWTTYLREGVQPHAYDAEAVALQSLMRRQHLGTVQVGTVVALPRTNLNNNWTYGDWDRAGWDLYASTHSREGRASRSSSWRTSTGTPHPGRGEGYSSHQMRRGTYT